MSHNCIRSLLTELGTSPILQRIADKEVNPEKSVLQVVWIGSTARLLKDTIKKAILEEKFVVKDLPFEPEEIIAKGAYYYALGLEQNWKSSVQEEQKFKNFCLGFESSPNEFCENCAKFVNIKMKDENASKEVEKQALLMKQWGKFQ